MIIVTSDDIPGMRVTRALGLVRGNSVRARHLGRDIVAALRNVVGGEVPEYTELMAQSREVAIARMTSRAEALGANAIVATRFMTSAVMSGAAEIVVYGTAVLAEPAD